MRRAAAVGLACLAAAGVAGCGSGGSGGASSASGGGVPSRSASRSSSTAAASSPARPRRPSGPRVSGPPVGRTRAVRAGGSALRVTVTRVLDPLRGAGVRPLRGSRGVGVALTLRDGGGTYDSTASGDVSLVVSRGQAAPLYVGAGPCQTQLNDFESLVGAGETRSGCVGFSVPRAARVLGVRFSPHSRARGTVAWRVR